MRLNITIDDDQAAAVAERATEAHCTRVEWIRRAVSAALDTGLYRIGTLDVPAPVPAPCGDVQNIDDLHTQIDGLRAAIDTLKGENLMLEQDRTEALLRVSEGEKEIAILNRLLTEKRDEVSWLRGQVALLNDKLTPPALPERAGHRWWKFWKK